VGIAAPLKRRPDTNQKRFSKLSSRWA